MKREPDWRGIAAVLIVVGVFTVLIIGAVNGGHNPNYVLSNEALATVSTLLGGAVGAVAVYLGGTRRAPRKPPPRRNGPPAPASEPERGNGDPPGMSGPGGDSAP